MRNPNWYDLNEQHSWPIADQATMIDDNRKRMPNNLIADINIWYPETLGELLYVSSVSVSTKIATVVILDNDGNAVAAATVPTPVQPYKHYQLDSMVDGVGGWIVFGSGVNDNKLHYYAFSDPAQSVLIPQVCRRYVVPPVTSIGKANNLTSLTGIVRLTGGDDIEVVKESREINSVTVDAAVIRLKKKPEFVDSVNLLEKYAGDCGKRPESYNCAEGTPIEYVNSVPPDCCGNITVEFRGCADVKFMQNEESSVAIGCYLGMAEACVTADKLPDPDGNLPNEYVDLCVSESIISSSSSVVPPPDYVAFSVNGGNGFVRFAREEDIDHSLPFIQDFSNKQAQDFVTLQGKFDLVADSEHPSFGGYSLQSRSGGRCLCLWQDSRHKDNWSSFYKTAIMHFSLRKGPLGVLHNAGLVFNYNPITKIGWGIELDHEGTFTGYKGLRLARYSPQSNITYASVQIPNTGLAKQYSISLSVYPAQGGGAWVTAELDNSESETSGLQLKKSLGPFLISDYGLGNGLFGFTGYRSITQFNRLIVDNAKELS